MEDKKKELRKVMLQKRKNLTSTEQRQLSTAIQTVLLQHELWQTAKSVALYAATQNEAGTELLLENAWASGKSVFMPRVTDSKNGLMEFALCHSTADLTPGAFNILEPTPASCPACNFTSAGKPVDMPAMKNMANREAPAVPANSVGLTEQAVSHINHTPPELFIIPGLAFDRHGQRLGFGGGFYDRFLQQSTQWVESTTIALAYFFQLVDEIPTDKWDHPVDVICTEKECLWRQ